jgi:hypothetical protein
MGGRIGLAAVAVGLLLGCGCVEQTQDVTINPDGTTKVEYDMFVTPSSAGLVVGGNPLEAMSGPQDQAKKATPDDVMRRTVAALLTARPSGSADKPKGLPAAWKDVKAEWVKDGRLHITATAYFAKPEDVPDFGGMNTLSWKRDGEKATLVMGGTFPPTSSAATGAKKEPPPDFAKMTDAEWADYLLGERVKYQSMKPMLAATFTDLKVKTVLHLPGEASDVESFTKGGPQVISRELTGEAVQAAFKKFYAQDDATLKAKFTAGKDPELVAKQAILPDAKLTVAKPAGDQFDYQKEVAAALAAYPELRKKYQIDPKVPLPGEPKK